MALATRCPACQTVFRIGTAQAAAKGGAVRCGVCRNVFNALDALVRVEDLDVVEEVVLQVAVSSPAVQPQPPEAAPIDHLDAVSPTQADVSPQSPVEDEPQPPSTAAEPSATPPSSDDSATLPDLPPPPAEPETVAAPPPAPPEVADEQLIIREWWMPVEEPVTSGSGEALDGVGYAAVEADVLAPSKTGRRGETRPGAAAIDGTNPVFMRPTPPEEPANRAWRLLLGVLSLIAAVALLGAARVPLARRARGALAARPALADGRMRCPALHGRLPDRIPTRSRSNRPPCRASRPMRTST